MKERRGRISVSWHVPSNVPEFFHLVLYPRPPSDRKFKTVNETVLVRREISMRRRTTWRDSEEEETYDPIVSKTGVLRDRSYFTLLRTLS